LSLGAVAALALAGCGSGASTPPTETLTAATPQGLSYALTVTASGKQQCLTTTYRIGVPGHAPVIQGSHLCGPVAEPGHPVLIQAQRSPESMIADVSASGCGAVRAGSKHADLVAVLSRCTPGAAGKAEFRVTILPAARRLVIVGIPGAPVINFVPRHVCRRAICLTALS
jgi:hypothetical protein